MTIRGERSSINSRCKKEKRLETIIRRKREGTRKVKQWGNQPGQRQKAGDFNRRKERKETAVVRGGGRTGLRPRSQERSK